MHTGRNPNNAGTDKSKGGASLRAFLNALGFLVLLVACFLIGFWMIGPRVRQPSAPAPADQSNLEKDADWGRAPERPRAVSRPKPPRTPAAEVEVTESTPESTDSTAVRETETLEQLSRSTDAAEPPAPVANTIPPPQPKPHKFYVQIGVYADRKNADTVVSQLANEGYGASVRQVLRGSSTLYQVLVGNPRSKPDAQQFADELRGAGKQAFLTPAD
jgi:cell division protein FtsN